MLGTQVVRLTSLLPADSAHLPLDRRPNWISQIRAGTNKEKHKFPMHNWWPTRGERDTTGTNYQLFCQLHFRRSNFHLEKSNLLLFPGVLMRADSHIYICERKTWHISLAWSHTVFSFPREKTTVRNPWETEEDSGATLMDSHLSVSEMASFGLNTKPYRSKQQIVWLSENHHWRFTQNTAQAQISLPNRRSDEKHDWWSSHTPDSKTD